MPGTCTSSSRRRGSTRSAWSSWRSTAAAEGPRRIPELARPRLRDERGLLPDVAVRVHRLALHLDLVVQVGTGGPSGVAGQRDRVAPLHRLVHRDAQPGQVAVERLGVVAVLDDDGDAVLRVLTLDDRRPRGLCPLRRADGGPDVDAAVELGVGGPRGPALAEVRVHRPAHRPAGRQRGEHTAGPAEEALERADRLALLLHDAEQPVHLLLHRRAIALAGDSAPDAGAASGRARLGAERLPDLG